MQTTMTTKNQPCMVVTSSSLHESPYVEDGSSCLKTRGNNSDFAQSIPGPAWCHMGAAAQMLFEDSTQ
ncbi:hypothetical protein V6N11_013824 [Hibiscus sabdariffa]|uniref:Uncharacterized protein n=1 Tax=Hibiscus sabdariffa TaxID=183260 RepID=A0ABR2PD02_9ROSI